MMYELTQLDARKMGREEGRAEGREEGRAEGQIGMLIKLVKNSMLTIGQAALMMNMTEPQFKEHMEKCV